MSQAIESLLNSIGLSQTQFYSLFPTVATKMDDQISFLKLIDAYMESLIIDEIDYFSHNRKNNVILIRFLNDDDFSLYEPEIFDILKSCLVHKALIIRAKKAIERTKKNVNVVYMETSLYETWLGINDFDDRRDLRVIWAEQQLKGE